MRRARLPGLLVTTLAFSAGCAALEVPLFVIDSATDAGAVAVDGGPGSDGGPPNFGIGTPIAAVSTLDADTEDPSVTADQLEMYMVSTRFAPPDQDIWTSQRAGVDAGWRAPVRVAELSTPSYEGGPNVSRDGLTMWFDSNRPGCNGGFDLWTTSRPTRQSPWAQPSCVTELSTAADEQKAYVDDAELTIVFMSDRDGGAGGMDLYLATRPSLTSPWSAPVPIPGVNTAADERDPCLVASGLQLFYALGGPEDAGIAWTSRGLASAPFGAPTFLTSLGLPSFDPFVASDLRTLYFSEGPLGAQQIYEAAP